MNEQLDILYFNKVLEGDKDAFRYFVKEYQDMSFSIAISIVKNRSDAEDVVQNGFIQAFRKLRSFRQESKFSSWLYKIVVNESLKHMKRMKNKATIHSEVLVKSNVGMAEGDTISNIEKEERKKKIDSVLSTMKPKEALIIKLHYLHERSIKEIMEITGFSESNIKVLMYRGRKSFKSLYK